MQNSGGPLVNDCLHRTLIVGKVTKCLARNRDDDEYKAKFESSLLGIGTVCDPGMTSSIKSLIYRLYYFY